MSSAHSHLEDTPGDDPPGPSPPPWVRATGEEPEEDAADDIFEAAMERPDVLYHHIYDVEEEDDDNDDDYEDDGEGDEEEDDIEFHDAEDGDAESHVIIDGIEEEDEDEDEDGEGEEEEEGDANEGEAQHAEAAAAARSRLMTVLGARGGPAILTHRQLIAILRGQDLGHILFQEVEDNDGEPSWVRRRRRNPPDPNRFPKVPSDEGRELMNSGVFGSTDWKTHQRKQLARRVLDRELGLGDSISQRTNQDVIAQSMIPSSKSDMTIQYQEPVYSGQFSEDGNFFFAVVKDFRVRMYDTSNPCSWRHYKTVSYPWGQWTLTDASLSPDNKWLAYTSLQPNVCLAPTDPNDTGDPYTLDLSGRGGGGATHRRWGGGSFAIWSVRFSGDGRELVAGTNASSIIVYDIESRQVLHNIAGHDDDVNAVCFADKSSPHILYSGSDDATIKVWDRRSMGDRREAGAFVGHCEGLTYIDSKGDGRYILSNGKDQCMKLWDLRMVMSTDRFAERDPTQHTRHSDFDYRWNDYEPDDWFKHPEDNSLVTFRGHRVQRTLIRCHFSPPGSTNSRYVYSGSHDGKVYVWNMDATLAATIDVRKATAQAQPRRYRIHHDGDGGWNTCVREAHWHPNAPIIVASAWSGYNMDFGTCTVHSYNDAQDDEAEPRMGLRVNEKLEPEQGLFTSSWRRVD